MGAVSYQGAVPTLEEEFVDWRLLEDRSTYSEYEEWVEGSSTVKRSLTIFTPIDYALPEQLLSGVECGFVAQILLNSRCEIEVGEQQGLLSLVSCSTVSGEKPSERGYREWLFESVEELQSDSDELSSSSLTLLTIAAASTSGEAPNFEEDGVSIPLLGDLSSYTEQVEYMGSYKSVSHSLKFYTATSYTLPESLARSLELGFMALVELNGTTTFSVGWSAEAASDRALRLVSSSIICSTDLDSLYCKEWTMESIDGSSNI